MLPPQNSAIESREWRVALVCFAFLLGASGWLITRGWQNGNLPGNEFRQAQTALSAFFIARDSDFSLAYPTPVFGAPWSAPMEFPLYQWTVVGITRLTGWPLVQSGRGVSMACFYLAVAALWPLLGRLGLGRARRLVVMGFVLVCPMYLYFSRAFLIETMTLAFALWFMAAFAEFIANPRIGMWAIVSVLGLGAGLVKVTTLIVFLIPAGALTVWHMRRAWGHSASAAARVGLWALASIAAPVAAATWWTRFADAVKRQNLSSRFLQSGELVDFNFGTQANRFSESTLGLHWTHVLHGVVGPVLLIAALVALATVARRWWRQAAGCLACYLATLTLFPTLYAWHEYYGVANAVLLLVGVGIAVAALLDLRMRWVGWTALAALYASQLWLHRTNYLDSQLAISPGGSDMTKAVRAMTNPDETLIAIGYDWDSSVPFYSQRRALMLRSGIERQTQYLEEAFRSQAAQRCTVFIRQGERTEDEALLKLLERHFDIEPKPLFRWSDVAVYVRRDRRAIMADALRRAAAELHGVEVDPADRAVEFALKDRELTTADLSEVHLRQLQELGAKPEKVYFLFGCEMADEAGRRALFAHANARLWFRGSEGRNRVQVDFCVFAGAYAAEVSEHDRTDGVEFYLDRQKTDGTRERIVSRYLNPAKVEADRGFHSFDQVIELRAGERIIIGNDGGPAGNLTRDWAGLAGIRITPAR